jgi:predicted metal-dependent TIM-barrel fold hydrolase
MQEKADRRHFPRYPFVAYSEVTDLKHPDVHMRARTSDLAREGCYVDTITPFDVGTYVAVKIVKNEQRLLVNGRVFYSSAGVHGHPLHALATRREALNRTMDHRASRGSRGRLRPRKPLADWRP